MYLIHQRVFVKDMERVKFVTLHRKITCVTGHCLIGKFKLRLFIAIRLIALKSVYSN